MYVRWEDPEVEVLESGGNRLVAKKTERFVPACYRRPKPGDPHVLIEQWIRAKYERREFETDTCKDYTRGEMRGHLMKKAKDENKYFPRYFILSEAENCLKYFPKEGAKEPKATIPLSEMNGFTFHLVTPERTFVFSASCREERDAWMAALTAVLARPLRPQDNLSKAALASTNRASRHSWFR
ncbi:hypothetical protein HAZT_HAZT009084 [Hyalella azteca]|uniref:PH domain-containing protein n=1 Tax=Hyalella azteca TaxID=294128 RepID=A0A6A0H2N3_HYAAZ|nr:hypothetical protein HAZT_HAZT009084 [Hyalella azteca]